MPGTPAGAAKRIEAKRARRHATDITHHHTLDKETSQILRQTNEKVTALFHKVHNLQLEVQSLQRTIAEANRLWAAILQNPSDRVDASAELARERAQRIEQFKKT